MLGQAKKEGLMSIDRIVISQTLYGQLVQNRVYMQTEEFQEVAEVAAHIRNFWIPVVAHLQHGGVKYNSIVVTRIVENTGQQHTELININGAQAQETQGLSFCSGVIQFKTGMSGVKHRGRYYVAAIRQGGTQFGMFLPVEHDLWKTQTDILTQSFCGPDGGSTGLALLVRGDDGSHHDIVTSMGMRPILGVQRRRNIGVGS